MSSFLIFHSTINDIDQYQNYAQAVPPTLEKFGGEILVRGKTQTTLEGEHSHKMVALLKFPDNDTAEQWYRSEEYQALLPTRRAAAEMTVISYQEP